jgi:arsenite-transporting ATPase
LGIDKLRSLFNSAKKSISKNIVSKLETSPQVLDGIDQLTEELCKNQQHGLIMTMGKGGVGKTIAASAIAVLIAKKGFDVLLTTTDPAAHIQDYRAIR